MSDDAIAILRADIAALKAILEERGKASERTSVLLKTVLGILLIQLVGTVFLAGTKVQKLETLSEEFADLRHEIHRAN